MIAALIIISLAFTWLGYESKWFTIRLESTEYQKQQLAAGANQNFGNMPMSKVNANTESENTTPYRPSEFVPLDMPEFTGKVNIICERG